MGFIKANSSKKRNAQIASAQRPQVEPAVITLGSGITAKGYTCRPIDWNTALELLNELGLLLLISLILIPKIGVELLLGILQPLHDLVEIRCGADWKCRPAAEKCVQKVDRLQFRRETDNGTYEP